MAYNESIKTRLAGLTHCRELPGSNGEGVGMNLACGSTVRFALRIDEDRVVADAAFRSNGCGHSRAAADVLAEWTTAKRLVDLHGLDETDLVSVIRKQLDTGDENSSCIAAATTAMKNAFADHRARSIGEFRGPEALICTCFGVTEERIETLIGELQPTSVDEISTACNAGSGCGSCRMLIQELLAGCAIIGTQDGRSCQ